MREAYAEPEGVRMTPRHIAIINVREAVDRNARVAAPVAMFFIAMGWAEPPGLRSNRILIAKDARRAGAEPEVVSE